jgi:hypothetical protein
MGQFSGAFGGLLAYAIHYMDGAGGLASWRWWVQKISSKGVFPDIKAVHH